MSAPRPSPRPQVTVVHLLYRAAPAAPGLVGALAEQRHPGHPEQGEWLRALFVDDASGDGTADAFRRELAARGDPPNWAVVEHPENLGLAGSLNRALGMVDTEFVLTCHGDCRFGDPGYVAGMLELLRRQPDAGAVTGKPALEPDQASRIERLYATAFLMDVLPPEDGEAADLVPVGFAEGRCDGFRMSALEAVGGYGRRLRVAGEDQVLAGRLRRAGFEVYQAPRLRYRLSVSAQQDSIGKLVSHQRLFGRVHPHILLANRGTASGVLGARAGANRRRRTTLRALQLAGGGLYLGALAATARRGRLWPWALGLAAAWAGKGALFSPHARHLRLRPADLLLLAALQPAMDLAFCAGLAEGLWRTAVLPGDGHIR
jgi:glycosyltransferase involved in cell wall biosynthesis